MLRRFHWIGYGLVVLMVLVAAAAAQPSWARGPRLVVNVNEPFQVGDRVFPAGELSLRTVSHYNPSVTIEELWIGSECLGFVLADRRPAERSSPHDSVVFERSARGRLVLAGYVLRGENSDTAFRFRQLPGAVLDEATARHAAGGAVPASLAAR